MVLKVGFFLMFAVLVVVKWWKSQPTIISWNLQ